MLEGINYLHAKFQINILKNKKVIELLELWQLWLKIKNSKYNSVVITTLKSNRLLEFSLVGGETLSGHANAGIPAVSIMDFALIILALCLSACRSVGWLVGPLADK